MTNVKPLTETKSLLAEGVRLGRAMAKMTADVQTFLLAVFVHAGKSGDAMALGRMLYEAGGSSGARVKAIVAYTEAFTPIRIDLNERDDKARSVGMSVKRGWKPEDFRLDEAVAVKWNEFTEERAEKPATLEQLVKKLSTMSNADKPGKDGKVRASHEAAVAAGMLMQYLSSDEVRAEIERLAAERAAAEEVVADKVA